MNFNLNTVSNVKSTSRTSTNLLYENQPTMSRFIGNTNPFISNNLSTNSISPPLNNMNNNIQVFSHNFSIGLGQQIQQNNMLENYCVQQQNYCNYSTNNNLNISSINTNNVQQISNQSLIASVIAANTSCNLNNTLFVGNLHASLQEIDLVQVFRPFGRIVECCKKWLHFGFVKFTSEEEACHAYVTLNGFRLKGRPMRLEFQNRTKKARIKAILAQAALQASNTFNSDLVKSSLISLGISNLASDENSKASMQISSFLENKETIQRESSVTNDSNFFDTDQLIKFAYSPDPESLINSKMNTFESNQNDFDEESKILKANKIDSNEENHLYPKAKLSPTNSPQHDNSCSLSSSSDSGCRSASFSVEDDSGFVSLKSAKFGITGNQAILKMTKVQSENMERLDHFNHSILKIKENSEGYDDENGENFSENGDEDCESNSDTSDDASDIDSETGCLNDLEIIDDDFSNEPCSFIELKKLIQVIQKDGSIAKKKLERGIYCSVNQTFSLFVEPQDVLKRMDSNEYEEYLLFPDKNDQNDSYLVVEKTFYII